MGSVPEPAFWSLCVARIVIVDDSLLIRQVLRTILTEAGHEIVGEAEDGMQAPLLVRQLRPDLVTLDLVMPGRSGMAALRHMLLIDPTLAVVVCSASLSESKVIQALRLGAKGFIVKPIDRQRVPDTVAGALALGSSQRGEWLDGVRAADQDLTTRPGTAVNDGVDRLRGVCRELAIDLRAILEDAIDAERVRLESVLALDYQPLNGSLLPSLNRLFDVSRVPIAGFDPPKFQTAYDALVDRMMMQRMDQTLAAEPCLTFALALDLNAYAPAHNSVFSRDCTGERSHDLEANRTKRFFLESPNLTNAARMELGIDAPGCRVSRSAIARAGDRLREPSSEAEPRSVLTTYTRDTGAELTTLSVPLYIKGHRWGVATVGWDPQSPPT
jgi:AmiR/NasT family two-component response regulator